MSNTFSNLLFHIVFSTKERSSLLKTFAWQEGYGAFTVSASQINATKQYISNQEQHHKTMSFQEEYLEFLKRNNIDYDPKYLFD